LLRRATESTKGTIKKWKQKAERLSGASDDAQCGREKAALFVVIEPVDIIIMFLAARDVKEKFGANEIKVVYEKKNSLH